MFQNVVIVPLASISPPWTRCLPARTLRDGSFGSGSRALTFSVRKSAARSASLLSSRSHFVPTSNVRFFSGSRFTFATESESASADGLDEVPGVEVDRAVGAGLVGDAARQFGISSTRESCTGEGSVCS